MDKTDHRSFVGTLSWFCLVPGLNRSWVLAWFSSGHSGFLSLSKNMHIRVIADLKLAMDVK